MSPTAGPTPTLPAWSINFHPFETPVAQAVESGDSAFFVSRALETQTVCQLGDSVPECVGQPAGTIFRGLPQDTWSLDTAGGGVREIPLDKYGETLDGWWASALPDQQDSFGSGEPRLFGFGVTDGGEVDKVMAVVSAIVDTNSTDGIQRQTRVLRFAPAQAGGDWDLYSEIFAPSSAVSETWLSGTCEQCYDYWEPWQGATN